MIRDDDFCDYCGADLPCRFSLRAVGFADIDGTELPQVRAWCGSCTPDDEIDPIADAAVRRAFVAQVEAQR